ncbi:hypothetical protein [Bradyrhizobium sp. CCBAU 65884]|uniref:hypothetical protein n=1 Tax=Bradyrhizobium sp. CCBAU 65884 TaxID=722477 RepID=UPI0023067C9B|nr:hypothetical protein [Bradyrhizobium sp. CCBAU 65884]
MQISRLLLEANLSAEQRHVYELAFNTAAQAQSGGSQRSAVRAGRAKDHRSGIAGVSNVLAISEKAVRELLAGQDGHS